MADTDECQLGRLAQQLALSCLTTFQRSLKIVTPMP